MTHVFFPIHYFLVHAIIAGLGAIIVETLPIRFFLSSSLNSLASIIQRVDK